MIQPDMAFSANKQYSKFKLANRTVIDFPGGDSALTNYFEAEAQFRWSDRFGLCFVFIEAKKWRYRLVKKEVLKELNSARNTKFLC
jgi:hypothetical protein